MSRKTIATTMTENYEDEWEAAQKKYIVLEDGIDFRTIAKKMTAAGYKMNHATARNLFMEVVEQFIKGITSELKINTSKMNIEEMLKEPMIHEALTDILSVAYEREKTLMERGHE